MQLNAGIEVQFRFSALYLFDLSDGIWSGVALLQVREVAHVSSIEIAISTLCAGSIASNSKVFRLRKPFTPNAKTAQHVLIESTAFAQKKAS